MFATCARDSQVRVFDTNRISNGDPGLKKTSYRGLWDDSMSNFACIKVLRCHNDAVKRITTEESDAHFLTVAEVRSLIFPPQVLNALGWPSAAA